VGRCNQWNGWFGLLVIGLLGGFQIAAVAQENTAAREVEMLLKEKNVDRYGYYLFLGLGDYLGDSPLTRECWTRGFKLPRCPASETNYVAGWDLPTWKKRIDEFREVGTNTLAVLFNGHFLPYPSEKYPDLLEKNRPYVPRNEANIHPNVKADFFNEVIAYAREKDIDMIAALCTTGHALGFTTTRQEAAIRDREGNPVLYSGIACHRHAQARGYAVNVATEVLSRYRGFWGVITHPPEFTQTCFCDACRRAYKAKYGKDLDQATVKQALNFTLESYLAFEKNEIDPIVARYAPNTRRLMFTIPPIFITGFEQFAPKIDSQTILLHWEYDLHDQAIAQLPSRLTRYRSLGHKLWFLTTTDFALKNGLEPNVPKQIDVCREAGVRNFLYFMGPYWSHKVEKTSWYLQQRDQQSQ